MSEMKMERMLLLGGGVVSLVFGILLFTQTTAVLSLIMILIGLTWFIQGVFSVLSIFIEKTAWGWNLFTGALGIVAGLFVLRNPATGSDIGLTLIAIILGIFGVLLGVIALIGAFQGGGWGAGLFGLVSLLIGLVLIFNEAAGDALVWLLAALLVIQGAIGVVWALFKK
jgi:uncharacterized membrane protein HdeD (DUF308 family)